MSQALDVIAAAIRPGATANTLEWAQIGFGDVARVRSALASKYAPSTANTALAAFKGVLKSAFRLGLIDSDSLARTVDARPIRGQRVAKGRALDADEITKLIGACDRSTTIGIRNGAIVALGVGCGLRRAEIVGLTLSDIIEDGNAVLVRGKGNKQRVAYLPVGTRTHLAAWLLIRGNVPGPLFVATRRDLGTPRRLTEQTVYDVLRSLAGKADIKRTSPHDLRRTFVSRLLDQGIDLGTVSAMAGHSSVATTARYDRRGERAKRAATTGIFIPASV